MFRNNFRDDAETKAYDLVRILEWVLSSICLALAIYIVLEIRPIHIVLKSFLLLVGAAYFVITLADIIVTSLLKPMRWTSWIIFALLGALTFFLCAGFLILQLYHFPMVLYLVTLVANIFAGCVFLFEVLYIISWLINKKDSVVCIKDGRVSPASTSTPTTSTESRNKILKREDKASQFSGTPFVGHNKIIQCPNDILLPRPKFTCIKGTCPKKFSSPEVPSHGGTFHVSKDVAPILSRSPLRSIRSSISSGSTPRNSPRNTCKHDCTLTESQNSQLNTENIEETVTVKCRTVSTSARMIPKQSQETIYTSTVKNEIPSADDFKQEENDTRQQATNQLVAEPYHRYSSPVYSQMSAILSAAQLYYVCVYCGRIHHYTDIESFTPCVDLNNINKYQRLPTVHENSFYSSTEKPIKDCSCCPYSATTSSSSKTSTPRIGSNQASPPLNMPFISKSTLGKTDTQLLPSGYLTKEFQNSTEKSQQPSFCKCKMSITDADELNAGETRSIDQRGGAIFSFEPHRQTQEIQTQSYKIEKQNDFTGTSCSDYTNLSTNQRSYFEPNCSSKQKNYDISNRKPDGCLCRAQELELRFISSNAKKDTVLPGTADRSPRNEINTEMNGVKHSQLQQPTVIDISDEGSNLSIAHFLYLKCDECREPTTDAREKRTKLRRPEKCTVM